MLSFNVGNNLGGFPTLPDTFIKHITKSKLQFKCVRQLFYNPAKHQSNLAGKLPYPANGFEECHIQTPHFLAGRF